MYEDAPDPAAGPGEMIVRVKACALNFLDVWERRGLPGVRIPFPHISGSDVAGIVESTGPGVSSVKCGDKTLVSPGLSCMACEYCFQGKESYCRKYTVLGYLTDGGYAELVRVPAENALPYPDQLDFTQSAAIPLVFMTAWHMLVERCHLENGETVLVLGAGSGIGSAAIQIAKLFHARVIATAGSPAKLEKASALGADFLIDHSRQKIHDEVKKFTDKRGVDVVFEHVGSATWTESVASLAHHGRLVTCGATTGYEAALDLRHLFAKQITIAGSYMGSRHELITVLKFVRDGLLKPVISEVLPLADAAKAQTLLENRSHFGKVVLSV